MDAFLGCPYIKNASPAHGKIPPQSHCGNLKYRLVLQSHGKNRTWLFRLISGILQRKSWQIQGYVLDLGWREIWETTTEEKWCTGQKPRSARPGAGGWRAEGYPPRVPRGPSTPTARPVRREMRRDPESKVKAKENSLAPSPHLLTSKWLLELEFTGLMNMTDYVAWWYLESKIST